MVWATLALGTSTTGTPIVRLVTPAAGSMTIVISNLHATVAVNGTLVVSYGSFPA
jgi:hypothetical protein